MKRIFVATLLLVAGCGGDDASTTTLDRVTAVEEYCAVLDGATTRGLDETMRMLDEHALPEIADRLDRMLRGELSGEDPIELGVFNEETCGVRFP